MEQRPNSGSGPLRSRSLSPVSELNVDVFDDEFAEDYAESVIAPSIRNENPFADPSDSTNPSQVDLTLPPAAHTERIPVQTPPPSSQLPRESIRKSRGGPGNTGPNNGFDVVAPNVPTDPQRGSMTQRTNSISSLAAPLSSTDGDNGPSHPYAMYPQALGVSRTASMATSSIYRSPSMQSATHRQGPAHPYALYPQDVFGDSSESEPTIPVGFPGHSQDFRRRLGPEDEEQDIVGPDGHTEQLPPYTRYPEAAAPRSTQQNRDPLPMIGEASQSRDNLIDSPQMSGALGSSDTTLNDSPQLQDVSSSVNSSPNESISEKSWKSKTWKEKQRHKVCGFVPVWMILLSFLVIVIIVVICGGVIGGYLVKAVEKVGHHKIHQPPPEPVSPIGTPTGYVDVQPLTTGTATIPALPTGTFDVVFGVPDSKYFSCLSSGEVNAWSCELPPHRYYSIEISHKEDKWFLEPARHQRNTTKMYGAQPPQFARQPLKIVIDLDAKGLGAAYHFQSFYDKIVMVPEAFIQKMPTDSPSLLSIFYGRDTGPVQHKNIYSSTPLVEFGDNLWVCQWEDTFIEGFIYVSESKAAMVSSTMNHEAIQTSGSSASTTASTGTSSGTATTTTSNSTPNTGTPAATSNPVLRQRDGGENEDGQRHDRSNTSTNTNTTPTSGGAWSTTTTTTYTRLPSALPNLFKIEERRLAGTHGQPVCTLHTLLYDGQLVPLPNQHGQLIQVLLNEDDGRNWISMQKYRLKRRQAPSHQHRHSKPDPDDVETTCFCQWTSFDVADGELVPSR